jgi:uncharacterized protein
VQYNVATLLREPVGATREYDIDERVLVDIEAPRLERVTGHATFLRTKDGVLVTARLTGAEHEPCSRCLRDMEAPVSLEISEEFLASVDAVTGARLPAPEDPEAFKIDVQHTLDLDDAVRQYWTAALPMQPLCRPDCRGLCPRCGSDLNLGPCSCPPEEDERWSALRQLIGEGS